MATTTRALALSLFLTGDPIRLELPVTSPRDLLAALGLEGIEKAGLLPLAPRVALLHCLTGATGSVTLRWVHLTHAPILIDGAEPVETVVVLTAPMRQSGSALRLVSRLRACLRDPAVVEGARSAAAREGLGKILAAAGEAAGGSPLSGDGGLSLLGSGAAGLAAAEAG